MMQTTSNCSGADLARVEAICFDVFGTLVSIGDRRGAYRPLLRALPKAARSVFTRRLLRENWNIRNWPDALGVPVAENVLDDVEARVAVETASVVLRPGVADLWAGLRREGLSLAVCSNLAPPYKMPILNLLPDPADIAIWSFEFGTIKPEPEILRLVVEGLDLAPDRILFVGDTPAADIKGPKSCGMQAMHIRAFEALCVPGALGIRRG